jgi:geranylgeranyl diphosphate synthase, type III
MDDSTIRQGRPSAHVVFGVPSTVMSSQIGIFLALQKTIKLCPNGGSEVFERAALNYFRGTGLEIFRRDNFICPDETEYITSSILKYTGYMNILLKLVQLCGHDKRDFSKLTSLAAAIYAISNDYSDFITNQLSEGKSFCDDVTEGKFTLPMIHAIKSKHNQEVSGKFLKHISDVFL